MAQQTESILEEIPYRFKISGNLIKKLGEESIASKNVAVLELIKNSHDANASKVELILDNVNTSGASIVISDNGEGMTNSDLENKWLNIATPNKSQKKNKPGERIPVGEKGIGRLSSESLGDKTILLTKPKGESAAYKIVFDWTKYQNNNVLCNEVVNEGFRIKKKKGESGTVLQITGLRHDWNDAEVQKNLLKDIYLLHPPNSRPKNFTVVPSFKNPGLKKIDKRFLDAATYHITVRLSSGNSLKYKAVAISKKTRSGEITLDKKLSCGDASFELYYYYRSANAVKEAVNVPVTSQKVRETNHMLDEYSGIKIYRDGFRVKPYGEENNDWLGLDLGFQNNTMYPRNNNVFGFVSISKLKNPKISDTTTREGIVLTNEFQDLISFVKTSILQIFLDFRGEVEAHKKKAKTKASKKNKKKKKKTVPVSSSSAAAPPPEKLIKNLGGSYPQNFYYQLEQEVNDCFEKNYPNASFFLSRKLVENLIFNILEKKYKNDIEIWYSISSNSHHKLSLLIKNLVSKKPDFKPNVQSYIEKFNTQVGPFRKEANSTAHNIYVYMSDKSELKKFKISDLIQLLLNIYHNM